MKKSILMGAAGGVGGERGLDEEWGGCDRAGP